MLFFGPLEGKIARNQSLEEVEKQHLEAFVPALWPLYHTLQNELTWLHAKWFEYRKLYAHTERRVDLLNETAPHFFLRRSQRPLA